MRVMPRVNLHAVTQHVIMSEYAMIYIIRQCRGEHDAAQLEPFPAPMQRIFAEAAKEAGTGCECMQGKHACDA